MKRKTTKTISSSSISLPNYSTYAVRNFDTIKTDVLLFLSRLKDKATNIDENSFSTTDRKKQKNFKRFIPIALLIIIVGGIIILAGRLVVASSKPVVNQDQRAEVKGPKATATINKEISIPLNDSKGKEITRLQYTIETAELRDEIIVKGARATSIKGRTFLILNIKLVNPYDKSIELNARDYVRLSVNGNDKELLAADIHNDPVSIQPISTKTTRIGFPINDTDTNLVLSIGEIKATKETVPLSF